MRVFGLLMALTLALSGCGSEHEEEPKAKELELVQGAKVQLPGVGESGFRSAKTPVSVGFSRMHCAGVLPEKGLSEDSSDVVDLHAAPGDKACLVELSVTNLGKQPSFFGSADISRLLTGDGKKYPQTSQNYSNQAIAASRGRFASDTEAMIQPGRTKWDYVIYEIPADAEPKALVYDLHQ